MKCNYPSHGNPTRIQNTQSTLAAVRMVRIDTYTHTHFPFRMRCARCTSHTQQLLWRAAHHNSRNCAGAKLSFFTRPTCAHRHTQMHTHMGVSTACTYAYNTNYSMVVTQRMINAPTTTTTRTGLHPKRARLPSSLSEKSETHAVYL